MLMSKGDFQFLLQNHAAFLADPATGAKAEFQREDLQNADLSGRDLRYADMTGVNLLRANLSGANLTGTALGGAKLPSANLHGADLRGATLRVADLRGANLTGADLRGANLDGADLRGANLTGADLTGAKLTTSMILDGKIWKGMDLSWAFRAETDPPIPGWDVEDGRLHRHVNSWGSPNQELPPPSPGALRSCVETTCGETGVPIHVGDTVRFDKMKGLVLVSRAVPT